MSVIGGLVIGKIVDKAVDAALEKVLGGSRLSKNVKEAAKKEVVREVVEKVEPVVQNANNQEPLYKSRVMVGTVGAILVATGNIIVMYTDDVPNDINDYMVQLGVIIPAIYAVYGRIVNKKPLWTK